MTTLLEFIINYWFPGYPAGAILTLTAVRTWQRYMMITRRNWFPDESEWALFILPPIWPAIPLLAIISGIGWLIWMGIDRLGMAISYLVMSISRDPEK